ncbi:hypothetical protein DFH05DRAFT_1463038 [Lentinula detonsa]|uniref:Uncharacterized protein n=1 Tax=Lentinula detonsa TaxID=2804962 RepID=A0A9W8NTP6_9AGAR|nr:hypothetical protein DFH05DRAFT_1463038 [Lentinula detonsa]
MANPLSVQTGGQYQRKVEDELSAYNPLIDKSNEEEKPGISKQAERLQKMLRTQEGNDVYESEEKDNPYTSSRGRRVRILYPYWSRSSDSILAKSYTIDDIHH